MLSSTSSSKQRLPTLPWLALWLPACLLGATLIVLLEVLLAQRGVVPNIPDSELLWREQRTRIKSLGKQALVIVGASRSQLGLDLPLLANLSKMQPVQLALDGASYWPVLRGLANDPDFVGTVIVDYYPHHELEDNPGSTSTRYESNYRQNKTQLMEWQFDRIENQLEWRLRSNLRNYADGARPLDSLLIRILGDAQTPQYLRTHFDRSRDANYSLVKMPEFYFSRVNHHLGNTLLHFGDIDQIKTTLQRQIASLTTTATTNVPKIHAHLTQLVEKINKRGGNVIFLVMPTSGMIREIENRKYPKALFWDPIARAIPATMIHTSEHAALSNFYCPDGSHLDYRDKARFTAAFAQVAGLIPNHTKLGH